MRNTSDLTLMLNNGGLDIARTSPDWDPFMSGALYLDNN